MTAKFTVQLVVVFVGVFALAALGCVAWLIHDGTSGAEVAVIAGPMGVALGVLGTLLSSTRTEAAAAPPPAQPPPAGFHG